MKLILHIGTEKTGTTTIQEFLDINREQLDRQGIAFLRSPGLTNHRKIATYSLDADHIDDHVIELGLQDEIKRKKWKEIFKNEFEQEIKNLPNRIHTVLISSEQLHSRLHKNSEVNNLFNLVKPLFDTIKIIVYLRRQDKVAVSLFSTACHAGGHRIEIIDSRPRGDNPYYNYLNLVEKWSSIFGKDSIKINLFEKESFYNNDLLQDFSHHINLEYTPNIIKPGNKNEQLSSKLQSCLLLFNRVYPKFENGKFNRENNQLRFKILNQLQSKYPGKGHLPSIKKAREFYDLFKTSNDELAKTYFNREILFSEEFNTYPLNECDFNLSFEIMEDLLNIIKKHSI